METINILAGNSDSGNPVFEEVAVTSVGGSRYRLLRTPGLVLGIARGDEIIYDKLTGTFTLGERGGNVAIQIYLNDVTEAEVAQLAALLKQHSQATWDGYSRSQAVFSFPAKIGFEVMQKLLSQFVSQHPQVEWYYGNVYAEDGVTPLNWWDCS